MFLKTSALLKMDSAPIQINTNNVKDQKGVESPGLCDLSPVTNLTLNLSGLSTSVTGTPIRRISWSNPVPVGSTMCLNTEDLSSCDSPTLLEILPRRAKSKLRLRKNVSKIIPSDSEDDKENIIPLDNPYYQSASKNSEEYVQSSSQDSGYSGGISENYDITSPLSSSAKSKSSIFTDDEGDDSVSSMKRIFQLDETDDADELFTVPLCMSSLLKKQMSEGHASPKPAHKPRYGKLPIRRCLSMEMDSESDSSASESISKVETFVAPSSDQDKFYVVVDSQSKTLFKRPEPPNNYISFHSKRRKSSPSVKVEETLEEGFVFKRSYSENAATIMHALLKADLQPELIGDGSRTYALPLVKGRHQDLKSISPETLAGLFKGEFESKIENFTLVDCRYPYEFEGGHIHGAKNIFTKEAIMSTFFEGLAITEQKAVIFHCEFSSERAPNLCRFLRNKDREINQGSYPHLHHPEMYILEGGYKAFFESHKELCEPQDYKPMNHKDHGFELRHFRAKSKSWGADSKGRSKLRSNSMHTVI